MLCDTASLRTSTTAISRHSPLFCRNTDNSNAMYASSFLVLFPSSSGQAPRGPHPSPPSSRLGSHSKSASEVSNPWIVRIRDATDASTGRNAREDRQGGTGLPVPPECVFPSLPISPFLLPANESFSLKPFLQSNHFAESHSPPSSGCKRLQCTSPAGLQFVLLDLLLPRSCGTYSIHIADDACLASRFRVDAQSRSRRPAPQPPPAAHLTILPIVREQLISFARRGGARGRGGKRA